MPTAARLVAAIALSVVSAAMVFVLIAFYPDENWDRHIGWLLTVFAICGFLVGWRGLGKKIAVEGGSGIGLGFRATISTTMWIVLVLSIAYSFGEIMDGNLVGEKPMKAVFIGVNKGTEYLTFLLNWKIVAIGFFLGISVGVLTRNTHRTWR